MPTLKDKTGWYRLEAVVAVTPQEIRSFHDAQGKSAPHNPPVVKTVAVLHMVTGVVCITDTDYETVLKQIFGEG